MNGDIEELVLSGKLFNPPSRSSSPVRSRSPSPSLPSWPNDGEDYDYDSDAERRRTVEQHITAQEQPESSIGMGPGRTGVKGVIRDRAEAVALARSKRAQEIHDMNRAMERASLGGKTWAEEERERSAEKARLEGGSGDRRLHRGRFGFLREVGVSSFVQAVEEDRNTWVLVHIYDPSLDRCADLDDTLTRLARVYLSVKFLRARAGTLGFASSSNTKQSSHGRFPLRHSKSRKILVPGRYPPEDDDDDPFADDAASDDEESYKQKDEWEDDAVNTDVLPTLLVYRGGQLEHAWVRVDWEAKNGIEEFLRRHDILSNGDGSANHGIGFGTLPDEDFDDGELVFGGSDDDLG